MVGTWLVIIPPIIVLLCAFITRQLNLALGLGLIVGTLIASNLNFAASTSLLGTRIIDQVKDIDNAYIYGFLLVIGILIVLLSRTGGANAFAHTVTRHLKNTKMVGTASILLSSTLFIDDYLSNLTVGYVMRPLTDRFRIPRAKLAFLVHSLSGPLVIIAPISSWVGMITGRLDQAGVAPDLAENLQIIGDPFFIYLQSIPFIFYSFLIILSALFIVRRRISYGPMRQHEEIARNKDNLFGGKPPLYDKLENGSSSGSMADLLIPMISLMSSVMIGIAYAGGYSLFGGTRTLFEAFRHNKHAFLVMFIASLVALSISIVFALIRKTVSWKDLPVIIYYGADLMRGAIIMLFLASTLSAILKDDLLTGQYLADTLLGSLSVSLLPLMFFLVSIVTATMTGSSWGTIALMVPIALPMLTSFTGVALPATPEQLPLLYPLLGAIFSGAVCGDHISPISETTIMAATSSGAYPIDHTQTQFPYTVPAIIGSAVGFFILGKYASYGASSTLLIAFGSSAFVCCGLLYIFNLMGNKKRT